MLGGMLIVRTHTVRITLNERLRDVRRRLPNSGGSGWSVVIQCELRKWVLVVGGRFGDRRRLAARMAWVGCRGERAGSRREISGFVLHGNYKCFTSEKSDNVM
jgi:hypothetical protein